RVGTLVENEVNVLGHQGAVSLDPSLDRVHNSMAAVTAEAFLGSRPQGNGTSGTDGKEDRNKMLSFELFGAKPTTYIGKPNVHLVAIKAEHRRDLIPATERVLNRGSELQSIAAHLGDAAPQIFHRMMEDALEHIGV